MITDMARVMVDTEAELPTVASRFGEGVLVYCKDTKKTYKHTGSGFADVAAEIGGGGWTILKKTANQSKASTIVLAADSALQFPMLASTIYSIELRVRFDTNATADFKYRHAGPAAPVLVRLLRKHVLPGTTTFVQAMDIAYSAADIPMVGTGTTGGVIEIDGVIHNGANAGVFSFQWAQNTSNAGAATVLAGSYLAYL